MSESSFDQLFGDDPFGALLKNAPEPPDSVPLRILGLVERPVGHTPIHSAFRRRVMELHPDLGAYPALPEVNDALAVAVKNDTTVQEAKWARDVLLAKVPDVTGSESEARFEDTFRNGLAPRWQTSRRARLDELTPIVEQRRAEYRARWGHEPWGSLEYAAVEELVACANRDCRWCGRCGRYLTEDEPVWRSYEQRPGIVTICCDCYDEYSRSQDFWTGRRCEQCGRLVHSVRSRLREFCSETCRAEFTADQRRGARSEARAGRRCEQCNEILDADRCDARYCSNACRQRAYRARNAEPSPRKSRRPRAARIEKIKNPYAR